MAHEDGVVSSRTRRLVRSDRLVTIAKNRAKKDTVARLPTRSRFCSGAVQETQGRISRLSGGLAEQI